MLLPLLPLYPLVQMPTMNLRQFFVWRHVSVLNQVADRLLLDIVQEGSRLSIVTPVAGGEFQALAHEHRVVWRTEGAHRPRFSHPLVQLGKQCFGAVSQLASQGPRPAGVTDNAFTAVKTRLYAHLREINGAVLNQKGIAVPAFRSDVSLLQ